jgi:hypothetical protein
MPLDEPEHRCQTAFLFAGADAAPLVQPRLQADLGGPFGIAGTPGHDAPLGGECPSQGRQREAVHHPPRLGIRSPGQMLARPGHLALLQLEEVLGLQPA